jgi:peptidoglycan L-alanyl-D-glutamate endopeptidase CwlK
MNHFSELSKQRLETCHKDLKTLFAHVIIDYDCSVICGWRGKEDQDRAFAEGKSQKKFPDSMHNYWPSLAVDVVPFEGNHIDWSKTQSAYFAGYVKGIADQLYRIGTISHRIRCGVDWDQDSDIDDTKFWDGPHFEIVINPGEVFSHDKY